MTEMSAYGYFTVHVEVELWNQCKGQWWWLKQEWDQWLWSVFTVSFSALTLLIGWWDGIHPCASYPHVFLFQNMWMKKVKGELANQGSSSKRLLKWWWWRHCYTLAMYCCTSGRLLLGCIADVFFVIARQQTFTKVISGIGWKFCFSCTLSDSKLNIVCEGWEAANAERVGGQTRTTSSSLWRPHHRATERHCRVAEEDWSSPRQHDSVSLMCFIELICKHSALCLHIMNTCPWCFNSGCTLHCTMPGLLTLACPVDNIWAMIIV